MFGLHNLMSINMRDPKEYEKEIERKKEFL